MTDIFTQGIIEDLDRRESGQSFDIEVDQYGVPRYVPKVDMTQPFQGAQDQTDPFAIAGEVTPMTPAEFAEKTFEVGVGAVGGTVATAIGTAGDIAGLVKGVTDAAGAEEGKRFEAFLNGLSSVSNVIGSERTIGIFEEAINALPIDDATKQNLMAGSKYFGEVAGVPVGGTALARGAARYAAGAPARVAERGAGMTLRSGLDPLAAIDEMIVSNNIQNRLRAKLPKGSNFDIEELDGAIRLNRIVIPKEARNQGAGSEIMQDLVDYADENNLKIVLTAAGDFGGSKAGQMRFYKRFGFKENKGRNKDFTFRDTMIREPQK